MVLSIPARQVAKLHAVVRTINDPAPLGELRERLGYRLLELFEADYFASFVHNDVAGTDNEAIAINMSADNIGAYRAYYQFHDPITARMRRAGKAVHVNEVMDQPELSGHDGERSYKVTARRAIQRLTDPRIIDLETIRADIVLGKDQSAEIIALKGTYNNAAETLRLYEGIQLEWSEGYTVDLADVEVDLKNGALSTSEPVSIRSERGHVVAGKLDYDQDRGLVRFHDGIRMTLNPAVQGQ